MYMCAVKACDCVECGNEDRVKLCVWCVFVGAGDQVK